MIRFGSLFQRGVSDMAEIVVTKEESRKAIADCKALAKEIMSRDHSPDVQEQHAQETIDRMFSSQDDGASAETGDSVFNSKEWNELDAAYQQAVRSGDIVEQQRILVEEQRLMDKELHRLLPPGETKRATPETVKEEVQSSRVDTNAVLSFIRQFAEGRTPPETESTKKAKRQAAHSKRTDVNPKVEQVLYAKGTCTSQGKTVQFNQVAKEVDWAKLALTNTSSIEEVMEQLTDLVTGAVHQNYGGWRRITDIIVRDQHLIINKTCFVPILDENALKTGKFPLDTLEYLKAGAVAGFFDWAYLKHMTNLQVIDIDDMSFYTMNIGGRLKCGRRIGVSSLFNYVKSLEVLVIGSETVTRDSLYTDEATPLKKKLATHKRHAFFSDGYKLNVMQHTNDFNSWTFNNMKNYAVNRGNKNLFIYLGGLSARGVVAAGAGILNLGTHLVGGIASVIKEAMTPVDPSDVGLN